LKWTPEEWFWANVEITGWCWIWHGTTNFYGYGTFTTGGRQVRVHRFAWELLVGPIPEGYEIDHYLCRYIRCVNPEHLRVVSPREHRLAELAYRRRVKSVAI
jgi:HNH endonuclease